MKTKQEVIKESYGEHWHSVNKYVDDNGWLVFPWSILHREDPIHAFDPPIGDIDEHPTGDLYRPASLRGIEDNNGWIRIESEEDLPKESINCFFYDKTTKEVVCGIYNALVKRFIFAPFVIKFEDISHYCPITEPKPPIY